MTKSIIYPGFSHAATELSAYTFSIDFFIVGLINGETVHFVPEDPAAFEQWLISHKVRDIRKDDGISRYVK
jgi:hypothetical protein